MFNFMQENATLTRPLMENANDDDEIDINDADMEFFEEHAKYANFLADLDVNQLNRNEIVEVDSLSAVKNAVQKRHFDQVGEDGEDAFNEEDECDFEKVPRSFKEQDAKKIKKEMEAEKRLPVKVDGHWKKSELVASASEGEEEEEEEEEPVQELSKGKVKKQQKANDSVPNPNEKKGQDHSDQAVRKNSKVDFLMQCEQLATLASDIMEDTEKNIGKLKTIRDFHQSPDSRLLKLTMMTELAIYKDIVPGYRIRHGNEEQAGVKLSKEVKKLRQYENTLLVNYQQYLQFLEKMATEHSPKNPKGNSSLFQVAVRCMGELLITCHHFNFNFNLITSIVTRLNVTIPADRALKYKLEPDSVAEFCCKTLSELFKNDEKGYITLETVKTISKFVKAKEYRVHPRVLEVFLSLKLSLDPNFLRKSGDKKKQSKKNQQHLSKKQKKYQKQLQEVEKEMKEAEAVVDREEKDSITSDILKHVYVSYFRVLKHAPTSKLLQPVLRGLCKFGQLINVEFFQDLLVVLKKILDEHASELNLLDAYHLVLTSFQLFSGHGEILNVDLKSQTEFAYRLLGETPTRIVELMNMNDNNDVPIHLAEMEIASIITQLMDLMFGRKSRHLLPTRCAAFVRRLSMLCTTLTSTDATLLLLDTTKKLLVISPSSVHQLLEAEDAHVGGTSGQYLYEVEDPERCQPLSATLWEFELLSRHWNPQVQEWIRTQTNGVFKQLIAG